MAKTFTSDQCQTFVQKFFKDANLYIAGKDLRRIGSEGPKLLSDLQALESFQILQRADENAMRRFNLLELLKLTAVNVHVIIDDSGSNITDPTDPIQEVSKDKLVKTAIHLTTILRIIQHLTPISVHYLNKTYPVSSSAVIVEKVLDDIVYKGSSKIGTAVERVWTKALEQGGANPHLIYVITDGEAVGEPESYLADTIAQCKNRLDTENKPRNFVNFGVILTSLDKGILAESREYWSKHPKNNGNFAVSVAGVGVEDIEIERGTRGRPNLDIVNLTLRHNILEVLG